MRIGSEVLGLAPHFKECIRQGLFVTFVDLN
jgi:hypothetical protein